MKRLLSLFDYSGTWSKPFWDNGWDVIQWDIKLDEFMDIMLLDNAQVCLDMFEDVDGIIAAAPCTDFAASGARWWPEKDRDGRTKASIEIVRQVVRMVDLFRPTDPDYHGVFFWAVENPVGRIGKMTGLEDIAGKPFYFDPYEFAGWTKPSKADLEMLKFIRAKRGYNITAEENEFIIKMNAYTKKTGLWGEFNRNMLRKPVEPVMGSKFGSPMMRYGGKGSRTKEERSNTPEGFAKAFYEANKNYRGIYEAQLSLDIG